MIAARRVGQGSAVAAAAIGLACLLSLMVSAVASAAPAWTIDSLADSTVAPGSTLDYLVETRNSGDAATSGQIIVAGSLPPGMTAVSARLIDVRAGTTNACFDASDGRSPVNGASGIVCPTNDVVPARSSASLQKLAFTVRADTAASGVLTASFTVSGGGAAAANTVDPTLLSSSPPGFGIDAFDGDVGDVAGHPLSQAGGHPAVDSVSIDFNTITNPLPLLGSAWPVEPVKDVLTDLPAGLVGNPTVLDRCTVPQLANTDAGSFGPRPLCPPTSQVGTTTVRVKGTNQGLGGSDSIGPLPVFNLVPPPGVPASFGFNVLGSVVTLEGTVRTGGDYGISVNAENLPEALAIVGTTVNFWGVPADPSHDAERACPGANAPSTFGPTCTSGAPLRAFLRLPTSCTDPGVGLATTTHVDSWVHPGTFQSATWHSHDLPGYPDPLEDQGPQVGMTGCDRVPFDPTFTAQPSPAQAGGPVGFSFDLSLPQSDDPSVTGESDLKTATVTLPAGVRVNPSSAGGLQGCSPAQIALDRSTEPACPDGSKIGTVTIDTPLLNDQVTGGIYLATPFDNPSHSLIALYLTASADGVVIKLPGSGTLDPTTGQITTTFDNSPQTPFSRLHLELKGGPRAPLALPDRCGPYTSDVVLTGWSGRRVTLHPSFTVSQDANGQPCPSAFSPGFSAGTASNRAGSSSSLLLRFTRGDGDQELNAVTVDLPGGLTGRIASVPLCSDAQAAAGTCAESSRIGDVTVGAGAGSNPFFITAGRAYLTGPYKGAPFGASIVVPAVAGPFDLGNVVVRSSLSVDKHTGNVRIVSDPLPTILQGIPLNVRDVRVNVDRSGFFLNPTSCAKKTIAAAIQSTAGVTAHVSDRFQAADCAGLGFKPSMILSVGGRGHTASGRSTPLSTTLAMPSKNQANLRFVRVTLPTTINARLTVINDACTRAQFETDIAKCAHAKAGTAAAVTRVLRHALRGSVYFVRNGHPIPDLFVALRGQVAFDLIGRVSIPGGRRLATTFAAAPDVPIRSFSLRLFGDSKNGSVGAAANLCSAKSRAAKAAVDYIAQNGKVLQVDLPLRVAGCPVPRRARKRAAE